ncbi:MAG: hypothetical protein IT431_03730 [Phycisphaerales bacterium]|nr:hypothetical protein [Phycisphaerales bacterium]
MGITSHYSGRAGRSDAVTKILTAAQLYAAGRGWMFAMYEDPFGVMEDRDRDDPGWVEHEGPYRGIVIRPHRRCEPVRLNFTIDHELRPAFTKTQFAPFGVHKGVLELLRAIEPHMERLEVVDESGLWESGDEAEAKSRFDLLRRAIDGLADGLRSEGLDVEGPDDGRERGGPYGFGDDAPPDGGRL